MVFYIQLKVIKEKGCIHVCLRFFSQLLFKVQVGLTFTHPLVVTQHVASWTFTLVWSKHVYAAEGAQQRVLGTLVDVWNRGQRSLWCKRTTNHTSYTQRHAPSQLIIGPGSNPSSHAHSNPPMTLVHVPLPQGFPMSHSSVSVKKNKTPVKEEERVEVKLWENLPSHLTPLMSSRYPMGHSQRKEPSVLMHWPLIQGLLMHSSISATKECHSVCWFEN